jgi:hypothetical protein
VTHCDADAFVLQQPTVEARGIATWLNTANNPHCTNSTRALQSSPGPGTGAGWHDHASSVMSPSANTHHLRPTPLTRLRAGRSPEYSVTVNAWGTEQRGDRENRTLRLRGDGDAQGLSSVADGDVRPPRCRAWAPLGDGVGLDTTLGAGRGDGMDDREGL